MSIVNLWYFKQQVLFEISKVYTTGCKDKEIEFSISRTKN